MLAFSNDVLATLVARRLSAPEDAETLTQEVQRIARQEQGTSELSGEVVQLAALIVQVCAIAIQTRQIIVDRNYSQTNQRLHQVLDKLVEKTGDERLRQDEEVVRISTAAVDVMNEEEQKVASGEGQTTSNNDASSESRTVDDGAAH